MERFSCAMKEKKLKVACLYPAPWGFNAEEAREGQGKGDGGSILAPEKPAMPKLGAVLTSDVSPVNWLRCKVACGQDGWGARQLCKPNLAMPRVRRKAQQLVQQLNTFELLVPFDGHQTCAKQVSLPASLAYTTTRGNEG
ncbi:hypothetical protein HaLaN_07631 [Haematococcus lacustris]|uniref:Uncharacterized protein n=1 Tax=Haematococcus lacustris TaxID=44745 RepID=A0A699YZ38_HAELA|nr:hypothetical protein HaLaN_07631 [Haematococcus lacustris]